MRGGSHPNHGDRRRSGAIPFGWIADNTRWQRKPRTYSSIEDVLTTTARTYRRAQLAVIRAAERSEREILSSIAARLRHGEGI